MMSKWVKEKNRKLRESDDWLPHELYKLTKTKHRSVKDRGTYIHVSKENIRDTDGTERIQGVTYKKPEKGDDHESDKKV